MSSDLQRDLDLNIRAALSTSPEQVSFRVKEIFYVPQPRMVSIKGVDRHDPHTIEAALDAGGEPIVDNEEWVRYEVIRDNKPTESEARTKDLLSVDINAAADDYMANCAKARASALLSQLDQLKRGAINPMPEGHMPLEMMGLNPHFVKSLNHFQIHSIQQLRDATEAEIARLPGGLQASRLRDEAHAFLLRNQSVMLDKRLDLERAEKTLLQAKVEEQAVKLAEMSGMLEKLMTSLGVEDDKPKRGRPPKVVESTLTQGSEAA